LLERLRSKVKKPTRLMLGLGFVVGQIRKAVCKTRQTSAETIRKHPHTLPSDVELKKP